MGITRRDLLMGGAAVGTASTLAGCLGKTVGASLDGALETPDPNAMEQDLDEGFDRLVWNADGGAEVFFDDTHGMDGFFIAHESDEPKKAVASCDAPRYGGSVTVPLLNILRAAGFDYPSRRFKFVGAEGAFSTCETPGEVYWIDAFGTLGTTYFTVPERFEL